MDQGQATDTRRYEIDALRVIALVLLIIYHIFICYQSFAERIGFLQYDQSLEKYWFLGELLNIWRIPVLFVVSGMAVGFVVHRRTLPELLKDRLVRLVPPLLFGALVMVPLFALFGPLYRGEPLKYQPSPGHLWFVVNLVSYSILLIPLFFWIRRRPENGLIRSLRALFPWGLLLVFPLPLMVETALLKPFGFAFFPTRFWYGLACYVLGFLLVCVGDSFWSALRRVCHPALALAFLFYLGRMKVLGEGWFPDGQWIVAYESGMWMLAFLGYGSLLLNRKTRVFGYF
ncbi:MAG: acyltransferase family protein, partial [Verrucomicrobiota bacterium]